MTIPKRSDQQKAAARTKCSRNLNNENVHYVEKADNPANLPECCPIENFWSILKGLVYKNNWHAENLKNYVLESSIALIKLILSSYRA